MKILSIETSCDETAVSVLECEGNSITVLGNALASQIEIHAKYGGVFPALAKRAHTEKIVPLLVEALSQAELLIPGQKDIFENVSADISEFCRQEPGLAEQMARALSTYQIPGIDHIAVTSGPGLEPALWVGINTALSLGKLWSKPVHPINHMEGHVISAVFGQKDEKRFSLHELRYPALALLVSGGHTELVLIDSPLSYKKIGQTRDDAVGEAFDKTARILGLPYPGGPKISAFAKEARERALPQFADLPRPMLHSGDFDFSFSGLKTAVLYATKDKDLSDDEKKSVAREFEDAAIEVLVTKTKNAIEEHNIQTLIVGGGVANNDFLREKVHSDIDCTILFPTKELSTDNSVMIGMALAYQLLHGENKISPPGGWGDKKTVSSIKADGNLSI